MSGQEIERASLTGEVLPPAAAPEPAPEGTEVRLSIRRHRCGECYRLITTPGDHRDGCSHIPPAVS
ncbi:hypothetical protein I5G62_gp72 [Mycobacterium phage CRB2]|uniref:Uncharacterized protein n=1 Tax=Mycobacterium phage CRB2 TaxID=2483623 RepID=A0A455LY87_9CAUD|nr:hypothetical protein I5G62_gp72 [Mycobacterium phage CRB2]AYP70058.1 hypothetical protein CRB2_72 [Mycobacterium phage CRB2]